MGEQHARQGHVLVALAHQTVAVQGLLHLMDVGGAVDEPMLALAHHIGGLVLVRQLADDGLQQIVVGDQPLDDAKLVRHQNEAAPGLAQLRQQPDHVDGLGHDDGLVLSG